MAKTTRTTLRSSTGTKLYAVREAGGQFKDIQSFKKSHAADLRQTSKKEAATKAAAKAAPKAATKAAPKAAAKAAPKAAAKGKRVGSKTR